MSAARFRLRSARNAFMRLATFVLALALRSAAPLAGRAATLDAAEIAAAAGFDDGQVRRALAGEVVSRPISATSPNEVGAIVGAVLRAPVARRSCRTCAPAAAARARATRCAPRRRRASCWAATPARSSARSRSSRRRGFRTSATASTGRCSTCRTARPWCSCIGCSAGTATARSSRSVRPTVSRGYDALQFVVALLAVEGGTALIYENRTVSEQAARFGRLAQTMGRRMLVDEVRRYFEQVRAAVGG